MKATEILEELEKLVAQPFDRDEFAFQFIQCFPQSSKTTLDRLRKGSTNKTDLPHGLLQRNNIHILTTDVGEVEAGFAALKDSAATTKHKAKYILATDGETLQAEILKSGDYIACALTALPDDHFGFLLPLAGITTNKEILDNPIDIKATSRLDKLYQELAKNNPDWTTPDRREDFNHFMAQLIFCFYAEDTSIFPVPGSGMVAGDELEGAGTQVRSNTYPGLFTDTVQQMTAGDGSDTRAVIHDIFRAMNIDTRDGKGSARLDAGLKGWADQFPYVNGGLFDGDTLDVPIFSQMARSYLIAAGKLRWTDINPDIFGSMIQAVADDEERGSLGMHYTSVPNILKVLKPLFLDDLETQLERAGTNPQQLGKLRKRMAHIRVFDPACGSGNFLVIAYKRMREIEHRANIAGGRATRIADGPDGEARWNGQKSDISPRNFCGIEIKGFAAEIARIALVIAEYQCDTVYLGQKRADSFFLPLDKENWIFRGNALRMDWLGVCPPAGEREVKLQNWALELEGGESRQKEIAFENDGGEVFICGNPPYKGSAKKSAEEKSDLKLVLGDRLKNWGKLDYVAGWIVKASDYLTHSKGTAAFVTTNSITQGQQVPLLWPLVLDNLEICFAYRSFKWANLAANDAGVTVVVVGFTNITLEKIIYDGSQASIASYINPYLVDYPNVWINKRRKPISDLGIVAKGNYYGLSKSIMFDRQGYLDLLEAGLDRDKLREIYGAAEITASQPKYCLWFPGEVDEEALKIPNVKSRIEASRKERANSKDARSNGMYDRPHQFREMNAPEEVGIFIANHSSESRKFLPAILVDGGAVATNAAFAMYDEPVWHLSLIVSQLHLVWIATVCGKLETRYRYSNALGWNTFPVPKLTAEHKAELTRTAEAILLAREAHFPATIADLYKRTKAEDGTMIDHMPENLRAAHAENDRILEEIYIGRPFRNDTERLEKLFEMYAEMTKGKAA